MTSVTANKLSTSTTRNQLPRRCLAIAVLLCIGCTLNGCAVIAVADAAVSVGVTAVKAGASAVGAVVDAASSGIHSATSSPKKD